MLWSIDSCQNSYQLTSVQLVKLMFFLALSSLVIGFQLITSSGPIFFSGGIQFASYLLSKFDESFAFSLG